MVGRYACFLQTLHDFQAGKHAEVAVVRAASCDGVDVWASGYRWPLSVASHDGDDVANAVDLNRHTELSHPAHY